jgi:hypothetical protein
VGSRRAATGTRRDPKTCHQIVTDRDRRSTQRTAAYLGFPTGSHNPQRLGIPPGNCSVGSDTEEDGGSIPPAPTMPALSRAFVDLVVTPVDGICGRGRRSGRTALNCLTQGVHFGEKPSLSAASRPPGAHPDVDQGPTPPPDRDWPFRPLAGSCRRVGDRTDLEEVRPFQRRDHCSMLNRDLTTPLWSPGSTSLARKRRRSGDAP